MSRNLAAEFNLDPFRAMAYLPATLDGRQPGNRHFVASEKRDRTIAATLAELAPGTSRTFCEPPYAAAGMDAGEGVR
jgi:hypothetical protein